MRRGVVDFDGEKIAVENIPANGYKVIRNTASSSNFTASTVNTATLSKWMSANYMMSR